jgi:NAD(P)-dependent dehydrogenase (short-subunit alcohol dehydrogenase family)
VGAPNWSVPLCAGRFAITGGGSGIGRGLALRLAGAGAVAYVLGRREEMLEETAALAGSAAGRVVPLRCDVLDDASLEEAFAAIEADGGPAPALAHCAAAVNYTPAEEMTPAGFREVVESVLFGAFDTLHRWSAPLLASGSPGVAVMVTSCIASRGTPGAAHSSAGKAGVEALVKTVAREWGERGVRVNAVGPGFFPVERSAGLFEHGGFGERLEGMISLGRLGRLEEAVDPIVFLLSEAASYMTGEVVVPDGGFRLTPHVLPRWRYDVRADPGPPTAPEEA